MMGKRRLIEVDKVKFKCELSNRLQRKQELCERRKKLANMSLPDSYHIYVSCPNLTRKEEDQSGPPKCVHICNTNSLLWYTGLNKHASIPGGPVKQSIFP